MNRLLRVKSVLELTGMTESTIYREISRGEFPRPVKLTKRTAAWVESEVAEWITKRIAAMDEG